MISRDGDCNEVYKCFSSSNWQTWKSSNLKFHKIHKIKKIINLTKFANFTKLTKHESPPIWNFTKFIAYQSIRALEPDRIQTLSWPWSLGLEYRPSWGKYWFFEHWHMRELPKSVRVHWTAPKWRQKTKRLDKIYFLLYRFCKLLLRAPSVN